MWKIIMLKLGLLIKYEIEYNSLIVNCKNEVIDYYDYKFCPEPLLIERALGWLKGRIQTSVYTIVYIERVGSKSYKKQFIF